MATTMSVELGGVIAARALGPAMRAAYAIRCSQHHFPAGMCAHDTTRFPRYASGNKG
jgi:hypothetical protein